MLSIPNDGYSGWKTATMYFKSGGIDQMLSFMANGAAPGAPPFMLLGNVSLTAVPEPEASAMNCRTTWGFFIHANLRWRLGPLEWLVATPAFHHWHHSRNDHINRNYASTLPVLDRVFGSHYLPRHWPAEYGTDTPHADTLGAQLLDPLLPAKNAGRGQV